MELPPVNLNVARRESFTNTGVDIDSSFRVGLPELFLLQLTTIRVVVINDSSMTGIRKEPNFMKLI
jgi:hypothetical protein